MRKVKFFMSLENELPALEAEINDWIASTGITLISVNGNIAPQTGDHSALGSFSASDVFVIVVYEDGNE